MDRNFEINRIRNCFSKSFTTYDSNAVAQRLICHKLVTLLRDFGYNSFGNLLEIGCGTGALTRELHEGVEIGDWTLNDLCPESPSYIDNILGADGYKFLCGDAREISITEKFNLIASASVFQWIADQPGFFKSLSELLAEDGVLLFSTFAPENMYEVKTLTGKGLTYPSERELRTSLEPCFDILSIYSEEIPLWFKSPIEVLRHLKLTGVTATGDGVWTKGMQENFVNNYKIRYTNSAGECHLTYKPLFVVAKKK